jgi:hypothetical protein
MYQRDDSKREKRRLSFDERNNRGAESPNVFDKVLRLGQLRVGRGVQFGCELTTISNYATTAPLDCRERTAGPSDEYAR